ncbi:MAG TPA: 2Fe-2S iron-sulfur cluster-binding protein [Planctomycetota bacterium]|nr:2Fe-2S iron-sulfur cluster-binding protein [Planctomycetota bacterium]
MPKITLAANNKTYEVPAGTKFLDFAQDNRVPHDFGCTVGSCGTCRLVLEVGADQVNPISDEERETLEMCTDVPGARLGCQLIVNGDIRVRQID